MKVILLEDIKALGSAGDIVNVKPGFANNFLIKGGKALPGTPENIARAKALQEEQARQGAENRAAGQALAEMLNNTEIVIKERAGADGKLFGSVTTKDIAQALKEQKDITIDKRKIVLAQPIRNVGRAEVRVRTYPEIEGVLTVTIEAC